MVCLNTLLRFDVRVSGLYQGSLALAIHLAPQIALNVDAALIMPLLLKGELFRDRACIQGVRARLSLEIVEILLD